MKERIPVRGVPVYQNAAISCHLLIYACFLFPLDTDELPHGASGIHLPETGIKLQGVGFLLYVKAIGTPSLFKDCLSIVLSPILGSGSVSVTTTGVEGDDLCDYLNDILQIVRSSFLQSEELFHENVKRIAPYAAILSEHGRKLANTTEDESRRAGLLMRKMALRRAKRLFDRCNEAIKRHATAVGGERANKQGHADCLSYQLPVYGKQKAAQWLEPIHFMTQISSKATNENIQNDRQSDPSAIAVYLFCKRMALFREEIKNCLSKCQHHYEEALILARERGLEIKFGEDTDSALQTNGTFKETTVQAISRPRNLVEENAQYESNTTAEVETKCCGILNFLFGQFEEVSEVANEGMQGKPSGTGLELSTIY